MVLFDIIGILSCALLSYWAVAGPILSVSAAFQLAPIAIMSGVAIVWLSGFYVSIVRYIGLDLIAAGVRATFLTALTVSVLGGYLDLYIHPVRFGIVFWATTALVLIGGRLVARLFLNRSNRSREPVVIYGAGAGGAQLIANLFAGDDYLPVAVVDDDSAAHGQRIYGLRVFPAKQLGKVIERTGATGVLLAVPSAGRRQRRKMLERLSKFPVHVQTIPEMKDLVSGKARVDDVTDVDVRDLLGREMVPPDPELLGQTITNKNVIVTGAGGSIGSELCRQIVRLHPRRLVLFEISEAALYNVDKKIRRLKKKLDSDCEIVTLLGSVSNEERINQALQTFDVQTVFHAAAYKHVPIVEHNMFEGIENNVFGTLRTARAAAQNEVETFVLVSTDKAVNPTNVMGATKRFSELILQAHAARSSTTRFCMVRFGNVLESSGSVVPLFREQIRSGGPVTVTHRDIIRYFMTIPEAAQLVIQAGSMAQGGDVFVLDMGKPVRIEDLARRMISLMGLTVRDEEHPEGDIEIQYIGLRPAEKLYEELLIGSNVTGTEHSRILRADEDCLSYEELVALLRELRQAAESFSFDTARDVLIRAVRGYDPDSDLEDWIWHQKTGTEAAVLDSTVIDFRKNED